MKNKKILIGTILAAFIMLSMPCVNALNEKTNIEKVEGKIQSLKTKLKESIVKTGGLRQTIGWIIFWIGWIIGMVGPLISPKLVWIGYAIMWLGVSIGNLADIDTVSYTHLRAHET